jgi:putative ABC transport system ATP-binding protein
LTFDFSTARDYCLTKLRKGGPGECCVARAGVATIAGVHRHSSRGNRLAQGMLAPAKKDRPGEHQTTMEGQVIIDCHDLTRDYQMGEVTVHALRGLDLAVNRGEFLVLLGPSGSGKTTTVNLIGGLDRPTGGQVTVDGEDIGHYSEAQLTDYRRRKLGFVFQLFNLIPSLTALENVEFALALGEQSALQGTAMEMIKLVGLEERADHFPAQLSGGEQQRVAIARALANHPPVLLCDEPTGSLDVKTGRQVLQVIRDFNQRDGVTVMLITHNQAIAPMADRVVRLSDGQVDGIEVHSEPAPVASLDW